MKKVLVLLACVLTFFACDNGAPRPRSAAERALFVQADKNFSTAMLPLDKYFERNGTPDEITYYRDLRQNYINGIKNAILETDPAKRDIALKTVDGTYLPQLSALQNTVRRRSAAAYVSDLENKNAAALSAAKDILGAPAADEVKTEQDKMTGLVKTALADPDSHSAYLQLKSAGDNFQTDLTNTVNKYAEEKNIPSEKTAKIFEPYNYNNAKLAAVSGLLPAALRLPARARWLPPEEAACRGPRKTPPR